MARRWGGPALPVLGLAMALLASCARPADTGAAPVPAVSSSASAPSAVSGYWTAQAGPDAASAASGPDGTIGNTSGTASSGAGTPVPTPAVVGSLPATSSALADPAGSVSSPLPDCNPTRLVTRTPGSLTLGAAAGAPWFTGDPGSGQGFDAAVGAAVAARLGYSPTAVRWVALPPPDALGRLGGVDAAIGGFVVPADAQHARIDYSTGYLGVGQAVVALAAHPPAATLAGLGSVPLAVVTGSPAAAVATTGVGGAARVTAYPSRSAALAALQAGRVRALVTDSVGALDLAAADSRVAVVGQLPVAGQGQADQLGMVLARSSALTACVSTAIDTLRADGTLDKLAARWLAPLGLVQLH